MLRKIPVADLVLELFRNAYSSTADVPENWDTVTRRIFVPEIKLAVVAFYGQLADNSNQAELGQDAHRELRYPGFNYSSKFHTRLLRRYPAHQALLAVLEELDLTDNEIYELCDWWGTLKARHRYEQTRGVKVRDTTNDEIPTLERVKAEAKAEEEAKAREAQEEDDAVMGGDEKEETEIEMQRSQSLMGAYNRQHRTIAQTLFQRPNPMEPTWLDLEYTARLQAGEVPLPFPGDTSIPPWTTPEIQLSSSRVRTPPVGYQNHIHSPDGVPTTRPRFTHFTISTTTQTAPEPTSTTSSTSRASTTTPRVRTDDELSSRFTQSLTTPPIHSLSASPATSSQAQALFDSMPAAVPPTRTLHHLPTATPATIPPLSRHTESRTNAPNERPWFYGVNGTRRLTPSEWSSARSQPMSIPVSTPAPAEAQVAQVAQVPSQVRTVPRPNSASTAHARLVAEARRISPRA